MAALTLAQTRLRLLAATPKFEAKRHGASDHSNNCRLVPLANILPQTLQALLTECQVDELWSFVRKKEAHLTVAEKVLTLYGDAWVWIAFAPVWRLVAAFVVGKRDQEHANTLLERLHAVSCGYIPFFTSSTV